MITRAILLIIKIIYYALSSGEDLHAVRIELDKDEEQDGERQQRRTSVAEEGQRDTNYREKADGHADIDHKVEEENPRYTIPINAGKPVFLSFSYIN